MKPADQSKMTLALALDEGPVAALETMVEATRIFAAGKIPDQERSREALDAWGIEYEQGEPISRMFTSTPTLKAVLPVGWAVISRGGGHNALVDARKAVRLRWHIHGWDAINVILDYRFGVKGAKDLSATEAIIHVMDGNTVIHTVPVTYPNARVEDDVLMSDGIPFYRTGDDDEGWTKDMRVANYNARETARLAARKWLDDNRPGHQNPYASWEI